MSDDLTLIAWSLTKKRGSEVGQVRIMIADQWIVLGNRAPGIAFFEYKVTDHRTQENAHSVAVSMTAVTEQKGYTLDRDPQTFTLTRPSYVDQWLQRHLPDGFDGVFEAVRDRGLLFDPL